MTSTLQDQATRLRELHRPGQPLILPNVWDAGSAKIVEEAGFPAIATASAAIAAMLGYDDHQGAPADEMFSAAGRAAKAVQVPVSMDAEAGYGLAAKELVERLLDIGVVGCNLEDSDHSGGGLVEMERQADYIAEVRAAASAAGVDIVINARPDTLLQGETPEGVAEAVRRGRRYLEAGADCVYPILARSEEVISRLAAEIPGPVNALGIPGSPDPRRLGELGVARISFGPVPYHTALEAMKTFAGRLAQGGSPYA